MAGTTQHTINVRQSALNRPSSTLRTFALCSFSPVLLSASRSIADKNQTRAAVKKNDAI
jgi:hypothetical protein